MDAARLGEEFALNHYSEKPNFDKAWCAEIEDVKKKYAALWG
jgi:hypothetical protein